MIPDALASRIPGNRRCIVSLCYDDALPCHFETVAPLLERYDLRATYYVPVAGRFLETIGRWRDVAAVGHELGNHTVFHPCYGAVWQDPAYHLEHYTPRRWCDEVNLANQVLHLIDGDVRRTFGNTCHDNQLGAGENRTLIETLAPKFFIAARGEHTGRPVDLLRPNWYNLGNKGIDGATFQELRGEIETLAQHGGWIIYMLHGVGPRDHELYLADEEHQRLVEWLGGERDRIWTAPVRTVVEALQGLTAVSGARI